MESKATCRGPCFAVLAIELTKHLAALSCHFLQLLARATPGERRLDERVRRWTVAKSWRHGGWPIAEGRRGPLARGGLVDNGKHAQVVSQVLQFGTPLGVLHLEVCKRLDQSSNVRCRCASSAARLVGNNAGPRDLGGDTSVRGRTDTN